MEPPEVDGPDDVAAGTVMGAKNAAIRKLNHELGIVIGELKAEDFKFLTRLHYWAADTVTHGQDRYAWRYYNENEESENKHSLYSLVYSFTTRLQSMGRT